MADPTAILERRRAEERRRGDSTVTDLMWLGAFDPQPFTIRETGFGNTGLTVEEAPVYAAAATGFDVDAAEDTTLDQPTYAAGPAGGVEDATLTPSVRGGRAIVEPQSDNETYNLWSQTDYYSDHFREEAEGGTELGNIEESLETNAEFRSSWVRAAREVYEMHYGREISENWSDERIAEWGLDYIREFNGALVTLDVEALGLHGGMTNIALKVRGGTDAQKQAFGFLMDSLDEADITGSGALAFAGNMLVDPTTYIGIGTFGAGTAAAQGAKLAARQGVKMAVRESMRQGLRRGFSTVVREGAEAAIRAPLRSKIATAGLIAASEGAIYGVAADANMQSVNISMGRQESYSLAQAGLSAGIGFAAGGVLGAGLSGAAPYIGRGTAAVIRPVENRIIRPTVRLARDGVSRIPGLGSGFRRSVTPTDAATAATRDATEGATTRAATDGPTGRVDGDLGASSPFESGGVRTAFAAPGTPTGKIIPDPKRDIIHRLAILMRFKNFDTFFSSKSFRQFTPNDLHIARLIKPATRFVDDAVQDAGIHIEVNKLRKSIDDIHSQIGKAHTEDDAQRLIMAELRKFQTAHGSRLTDAIAKLDTLAAEIKGQKVYDANTMSEGELGFTGSQKQALLGFVDDMRTRLDRLNDPSQYDKLFDAQKTSGTFADFVESEFRNLTARINDTQLRLQSNYYQNGRFPYRSHIRDLPPGAKDHPQAHAQNTEHLERSIIAGYYNPENRARLVRKDNPYSGLDYYAHITNDIIPIDKVDNAENIVFKQMLGMFREIRDGKDRITYNPSQQREFAEFVAKLWKHGYDNEAVQAIRHLEYLRGPKSLNTYPEFLTELKAKIGDGPHARTFMDRLERATTEIPHDDAEDGQRAILKLYAESMEDYYIASRFRWGNRIATPIKNKYIKNPLRRDMPRRIAAHFSGGRVVDPEGGVDSNAVKIKYDWWFRKKEDGASFWENNLLARAPSWSKIPYRFATAPLVPGITATKFLFTNPASRRVLVIGGSVAGGAIAIEEGSELIFDYESDLDIGSRILGAGIYGADLALSPLRWSVDATAWADDILGLEGGYLGTPLRGEHISLYDNPLVDLGQFNRTVIGDRGNVSEEEARAHLENYTLTDANGMTRSFNSLPVEYQAAMVESLDAANDLSDEAINEVYQAILAAAPLPSTTTTTTTPGGTTTTPGGTTTTTTTTPPPGGTVTAPPPGSPVNTTNGPSGWQSAGQVASDVGNAAFGWLGGDTVNSIGNVFSSSASWIGGMFEKLSSGKVRDGEKWLAGGFGLVAALIGTPMILKTLGLENVPFVGLVVAALVFGFGGKLAHDVMLGQGTGRNRTNGTNVPRTTHNGTPTPPKVLAQDNPGTPEYPWDSFRAADEDNNGQYAAQLSLDGDTSTFVDLKILNPTEVAALGAAGRQRLIDEANAEDRFITNDFLQGQGLDKFENWEFTATNTGTEPRPDNEVAVFAVHEASGETFVLELDAPT